MNATFGPFILSFPCVNEPDDKYDVYTANGVEDPNSKAMKDAKALLAKAIKEFGLDEDGLKLPLTKEMQKDPNAPQSAKKPKKVPTGKLILKSKSKRPPMIYDVNGDEVNPSKVEVRGGTKALVQGFLSPYDMSGQEGISFTLTGIQIIKLAKGRSSEGFGAYQGDDGEEIETGEDEAPGLNIGSDDDGDDQDDDGGLDI